MILYTDIINPNEYAMKMKRDKILLVMRSVFFVLCLCYSFSSSIAQEMILTGTIHDDNHEAIPFANVALFTVNDTTKFIQGSSSSLDGVFCMKHLAHQKYLLKISYLGYKTSKTVVDLRTTSKHIVEQDITLHTDAVALKEVIVSGKRATQSIDKVAYTFTKDQIGNAQQCQDLVSTLPNLHLDEISNSVAAINGKSVMILINGVQSTNDDLKLIPANKIKKVDYYDVPPMRYMNDAEIVINVHTKPLDTGVAGSFFASYGQMFSGGNAALSYVKGNNKWVFSYGNHFNMKRDVKNKETGRYNYRINNNQYSYNYDKQTKDWGSSHLGYITYANSVEDKHQLQIIGGGSWMKDNSEESKSIVNIKNQMIENNLGALNNKVLSKSASLEVYYSQALSQKDQLTVDVLGTYYNNSQDAYSMQTGSNGFEDNLDLDNNKHSIIGELIYEREIGKTQFSTGYRGHFNYLSNDVTNSLTDDTVAEDIQIQKHYLYGEVSGRMKSWMYRVSLAGTYDTKLGDTGFNHATFTPLFMMGYRINPSQSVRLSYNAGTNMPGVQQMSNTRILIMNDFYQTGNPDLHNEKTQKWTLKHNFNNSWLTLNTSLYYQHQHNALYNAYRQSDEAILLQTDNAKMNEQLGGRLDINITPCKYIRISGSLGATQYRFRPNNQVATYKDWTYPVSVYLSANYKKATLSYYQKFGGYDLDGLYKTTIEKASYVYLGYTYKKFRFGARCFFPFVDDEVSFETIPGTKVVHKKDLHMRRKDHTFGVTISWYFNRGKRKSIQQKTDNRDDDKGVFKL